MIMEKNLKHIKIREPYKSASPFLFGFYEKIKRKELGYSLDNVSKDLSISKGNLSEMENGLRIMKIEIFHRFLTRYNIEFAEDLKYLVEMREILIQIFEAFLRFNRKKQEKVREQFESMDRSWENTSGFLIGLLIEYFIRSVLDHKSQEDVFELLVSSESCLSNDEKALLYMIRGMEGRRNTTFKNKETFFEQALNYVDEKEMNDLEALIEYYQIMDEIRSGSTFEVYAKCSQVRNKFYNSHNYIRALYLDNLEAVSITYLRAYSSAYRRFETLLYNMEYVDDPYLRFCVVQNAILVLCVLKEYKKALEWMKKERNTFSYGLSNFVFAPYCFYMLDDLEEANNTIKKIKPYVKDQSDQLLLNIIKYAIENNENAFFEDSQRLLILDQKNKKQENIELTYRFMISFYKKNGIESRQIKLQEEYISFLTR